MSKGKNWLFYINIVKAHEVTNVLLHQKILCKIQIL